MTPFKKNWVIFWGKEIASFIFTMGLFWGYSLLLVKTNLSEEYLTEGVTLICLMGALFAGFLGAFSKRKSGWAWGLRSGGVYGALVIGMNYFSNQTRVEIGKSLILLILTAFFGIMGGIFGVNRRIES